MDEQTVKMLIRLVDSRKAFTENIERLTKMVGKAKTGGAKCYEIRFCSEYSTHMHTNMLYDDGELNILLVDVALKYYRERLENANMLVNMAATALEQQMGPDFQKLLAGEKS